MFMYGGYTAEFSATSYAPFNTAYLPACFMENFRDISASLSEAKVSPFLSLCDYLETQFLGATPWSFKRGDHYNYFKNIDSDMTSNSVETQNNQLNRECNAGTKRIEDLVRFMADKKRENYNQKLFVFRQNRFNNRKKSSTRTIRKTS